ncbi:hypothetical protein ABW21_db0206393 [Orbilia brochopaga]|nr:hypothetical protein ABW21_db0206393 [Drechslerella brochopaga]
MFLAYLQREIWLVGINWQQQGTRTRMMDCILLEGCIKERLKFGLLEASKSANDLIEIENLIAAISNSFTNLAAIIETSPEPITLSLKPTDDKGSFDLFPIIRKSNGGLLLGRIAVRKIEEQAIVIPITPTFCRGQSSTNTTSTQNVGRVLVPGAAAVYEPKRSNLMGKNTSMDERSKSEIDVTWVDVRRNSTANGESLEVGSNCATAGPGELKPPIPPRPILHRKPRLPSLETSPTGSTPKNSTASRRHLAPRASAPENAPNLVTEIEPQDQQCSPDTVDPRQVLSSGGGRSTKRSLKDKSAPNESGTPLAAIWRTLEEWDKRS